MIRITETEAAERICDKLNGDKGKNWRPNDLGRPASYAGVIAVLEALGLVQIEKDTKGAKQ